MLVFSGLIPFSAMSIPEVSPEESRELDILFEELVDYRKQFIMSSSSVFCWKHPSFQKMANRGPRILSYLSTRAEFRRTGPELGSFWTCKAAVFDELWRHGMEYPFEGICVPWEFDSPMDTWRGGREVANIRTAFILSEWRLARQNGHAADERLAVQTLRCLGISAYEILFRDLSAGFDDVLDVFAFINQRDHRWENIDKAWLLHWWRENEEVYRLPAMDPNYPVSQLNLDEWKRYNF